MASQTKVRKDTQLPFEGGTEAVIANSMEDIRAWYRLRGKQHARIELPIDDLVDFFGEESGTLVTVTLGITVGDFLMAQRALDALLEGWEIVRECSYDFENPAIVQRQAVQVGPKVFDFVVHQGRQFRRGPNGERLVIDLEADESRNQPWSEMTFFISQSRHQWLREMLPRIEEWTNAHHFLRNQIFTVRGEFIEIKEPTTWDDVLIPAEIRTAIQRNCIELLKFRDLFKENGIPLKRGILLHGKPGTGKTMIGRALAQHCGVTFILVTPGMIDDPGDVRRVFRWGRLFAPSILFFEDFDMVAGDRNAFGQSQEILGEFLAGLDGLDAGEGVIAIATTNDLEAIEPALRDRPNRFDCVLEIPTMNRDLREEYLTRWLKRHESSFPLDRILERTKSFSGAQMQELCRLAVFEAVEERIRADNTKAERLPLTEAHFTSALAKVPGKPKPSIGFFPSQE